MCTLRQCTVRKKADSLEHSGNDIFQIGLGEQNRYNADVHNVQSDSLVYE
jgi:hypothetical protein